MNIFFGPINQDIASKYTVLELDTFCFGPDRTELTAYCVLDNVYLSDLSDLPNLVRIHHAMMQHYRSREWESCLDASAVLTGRWGGQLDSFYDEIAQRVKKLAQDPPGAEWTGSILRD